MIKRIEIKVYGTVQGVFFRVFVKEKFEELGLFGWACNETDGTVTILAEGNKDKLEKLAEYCQKGSRFAKVDRVEVKWKEATGEFKSFVIK